MAQWTSIAKNAFALAITNIINPVVSFALVLLISRYLGVKGLGEYSLIFSYIGIFGTLASLGLGSYLTREVARHPREVHDYVMNAAAFGAAASGVAVVTMDGVMLLMGYEREVLRAAFIYSFSMVVSTGIYYLDAALRAAEKSEFIALTYLPENCLRVALCVLLLIQGYGIVSLFIAILSTRVLALVLIFFFYVRTAGRPVWRIRPDLWRVLAKEAPTFTSIVIFSSLYNSVDQIMLSKLATIDAVGLYSASNRLVEVWRTVPIAFSGALLPFLTTEFARGREELARLCATSLRFVFMGSLPIAIGTTVLSDQIIVLIYGEKFAGASALLAVQIFALIPYSMVLVLATVLIATDNQRIDLTINMVSAGLNFLLNFLLIPLFAEMGAVLATLVTIIIFNQLQYMYIRRNLFSIPFLRIIPRPALAAVGMGFLTYFLRDWNVFANVITSAAAYLGLLIALGGLSREEIGFLPGLIRRRKREPNS
ncbi:MAG: flippase [Deltaproteobacteria bacterium]|nr:flippase [Deltaproteobacteria bacterium]